jgi:WD40 repeat protein/serine/threonine protein kinase
MAAKALIDELLSRWNERRVRGESTSVEELCRDHPELITPLRSAIAQRKAESVELTSEWSSDDAARAAPAPAPSAGTLEEFSLSIEDTEAQNAGLGPPQGPDEIGRLGPFRVIKLLGSGGMGSVFQAVDCQLERYVALKVLRPRLAGAEVARQRFLREARMAAALEHDHVVAIYQVGEDRGIPYLAMPLLRGQTLQDRIQGAARLEIKEAIRIAREVAEGLAAAHEQGLVHRDVKPANVWLEEATGRVKILDFGLARSAEEEEAGRLTQDGTILGTPAYMAPEQASGGRAVDHRSDLFSLGCLLYRMLTGKIPFAASSHAAMLLAITKTDPVPPCTLNPQVPPPLDALTLGLLAKDPAARPPSARAVVEALRALELPPPAAADPAFAMPPIAIDVGEENPDSLTLRPAPRPKAPANRARLWWLTAGGVALCLIGGLLASLDLLPRFHQHFSEEGTLVLEAPRSVLAVAVAVKHAGHPVGVLDTSAPAQVLRLPAGDYELVLSDTGGTLQLADARIALRRGERKLVRLVPVPRGPAAAWPPPPAVNPSWPLPPDDEDQLPGLIPHPTPLAGMARWQIATRRPRKTLVALAWSPDHRRLACASTECLVRIYDAARLDLVGVLVSQGEPFACVAWSPDGQQLATGSTDGTVQLWAADGKPGALVQGHSARVTGLAWNHDGTQLASASLDTSVRLWTREGKPGPVLAHPDRVHAVGWSPDGTRLVSGCEDKTVRVWSAAGKPGPVLKGHSQAVAAVAWSPDGLRIASAGGLAGDASDSGDTTVRIWRADGTPGPVLKGHTASITALAWSPDGKQLASASEDKSLRFWFPGSDAKPGKVVRDAAPIHCLAWGADGQHVATGGGDCHLQIWHRDGSPGVTFVGYPEIESIAVRGDGQRLAAARRNTTNILIWGPDAAPAIVLKGHTRAVTALAWSPDGSWLASGSRDASARFWRGDGTPGPVFHGHRGEILCVAWSPDGKRIATASRDATVRIWNRDGAPGPTLNGHTLSVFAVAWSPDGKQLVSAGRDGTVRLWDAGGTPKQVLVRYNVAVDAVAWSPDGLRIAAGNRLNDLQLWGAAGAPGPTLRGNDGHVTSVSWHPDSVRLALGSNDPAVCLWDISGLRGPVLSFDLESDAFFTAWTTGATRLVAAGHAGSVRAWNGRTLEPEWIAFQTSLSDVTAFTASGSLLRSTPAALREFLYLVERPDEGVDVLSHEAFEKRRGTPSSSKGGGP